MMGSLFIINQQIMIPIVVVRMILHLHFRQTVVEVRFPQIKYLQFHTFIGVFLFVKNTLMS